MKKLMAAILSVVILGAMALPAAAQGRSWNRTDQSYSQPNRSYQDRNVYRRQQQPSTSYDYRGYDNRGYDNRSFWDQHRDKLTTGIGAVAGALLGQAVGGGRGAAVGALVGGGGSALYTYKLRGNRRH
jgi:uncharacterized protein YxeA